MLVPPCKACDQGKFPDFKRYVGCHANCPLYQEYQKQKELIYEKRKVEVELEYAVRDCTKNAVRRATKRKID